MHKILFGLPQWLSGKESAKTQEPQEMRVPSLCREDSLEKEMATPLQYPHPENPRDRGAWWATVHEVAKSQTRLSN